VKFNFAKEKEIQKFWSDGINYTDQKTAIKVSLERAVEDFTSRTEKKKANAGKESLAERLQCSKEENLIMRLVQYFQAPPKCQDSFNSWHCETCKWIQAKENEMYENVAYGKAQKILNMTFKNLYCTAFGQEKENENENFFKFCHIALDSFTLEWIFRNIYPRYKELGADRLCKGKTPAWSRLTYEERKDNNGKEIYSYPFIADLIAKYFSKKHPEITPFQAEFVIWR